MLNVWSNVWTRVRRSDPVGVARAILAIASLSTLLLTPAPALFLQFLPSAVDGRCVGISRFALFCTTRSLGGSYEIAVGIAAIVLVAVLSGYAPRVLAVPHFYIAWSISQNVALVEGGDQVNAAVTMLMIPWLLVNSKHNAYSRADPYRPQVLTNAFAYGSALLIRVQLTLIYAIAALAKMGVPQWADGSALWYWLQVPTFGLPPHLFAAIAPILEQPIVTVSGTYGVMVFELALAASIWVDARWARYVLIGGIVFHAGIALVLGLWSFGISMTAVLLICRALQQSGMVTIAFKRPSPVTV